MQLRPFQKDLWEDQTRFKCAVVHRRAGKTVLAVKWLLEPALDPDFPHELPGYRGFYVCPYAQQARDISLVYFEAFARESGLECKVNRSHLTLSFPDTGAVIQLLGTEYGADKLRGRLADRIVMDETAHISPGAWTDVLRPMLSDRKGEALAIGTPNGRLNHFYRFHQLGQDPAVPEWSAHLVKASESGLIPADELEQLRAEMGERSYAREYECSFDAGAAGAFFEEEMAALKMLGRIGPYRVKDGEVHTCWHFGPSSICIQWVQIDDGAPVFFKAKRWEHARVEDVVSEVLAEPYTYGQHYTGGNIKLEDHRIRIAKDSGLRLRLVPKLPMSDAVALAKSKLLNARFCAGDGVEAMKSIHAKYDDIAGTYSEKAVEDMAFELASPVLHFFAGHNDRRSDWSKPIQYGKRADARASRAGSKAA